MSPIYKVHAHTTYKENGCKGGFMRVQRYKDMLNHIKTHNNPY